jgi:histidinol-phosphate aminotransferase
MKFNKNLKNVKVYEAGKPIELVIREYGINPKDIIKLASNENPYGTSKKVVKVLKQVSKNAFRYPDDSMYELKNALADKFKVNDKNIIIGAGSDQIIEFCVHGKCDNNSTILMAKTTFAMYEIYGRQVGAKILKTKSDTHNLDEFSKMYKKYGASIIFLCLPNNPMGECLDTKDVYRFLDTINKNTLVVLDGAYQEFASFKDKSKKINPKDVIKKYPNTIYLGTFSKAYGLGGMRVGYGIASQDIIDNLYKLRAPFNITTLSLASAIEALKDEKYVKKSIIENFKQMSLYENWAKDKNFKYINSYTNFITIYLDGYSSKDISQKLLQKGIIVRDMTGYGLNAIRITIGTSKQNKTVLRVLNKFLVE